MKVFFLCFLFIYDQIHAQTEMNLKLNYSNEMMMCKNLRFLSIWRKINIFGIYFSSISYFDKWLHKSTIKYEKPLVFPRHLSTFLSFVSNVVLFCLNWKLKQEKQKENKKIDLWFYYLFL